jgi:hypothetical protein
MRRFPLRVCGYALVFVGVLCDLYVRAYLMLVEPMPPPIIVGPELCPMSTTYRLGGKTSAVLFAPLEEIDRRLFPDRWLI